MGYRVPWGEWPQGALLGTSRGRVAEPEGFRDSIKLDNAIMRRSPPFPPPYGYHVKNRRTGCFIPRDRVRQERAIRLVSQYRTLADVKGSTENIFFDPGRFGIPYASIFHCYLQKSTAYISTAFIRLDDETFYPCRRV